ncbi:PAB-dependent poly(A)-specific ribonuclease subunit PAN3 protein [Rutstroemia sp. NJR-2017a BBW]|nr:PAB-dependent poly(A)-specific ribonuclease subunit PAN3 protein [Rutstroemia sp. NJR-2017a BBW]
MAATRFNQPELRRPTSSPRPKGRENAKDTLCRNVLIYGHCRYEDQGCAFNHDPNKGFGGIPEPAKKTLNVDSPSFTPAVLPGVRGASITSQAANAAPFTPRALASGTATPNSQVDPDPPALFNPATIREFTPQNYDISQTLTTNGTSTENPYDPFQMAAVTQAIPTTQYNPYLEDTTSITANGGAFFQGQTNYSTPVQPLLYHLYAPVGPHKEDLLPYQRSVHDLFMSDRLREELQKKSEASLQVMPNSGLPQIDPYHSLVALDTTQNKSVAVFGYPSWVYKATSAKNGKYYCLRRLEGYRLTNDKAIRAVKEWRTVNSAGVVSFIDAFTTRQFGDSSLIIVTNYHPLSKTLYEHHFSNTNRYGHRASAKISEETLWAYIVQITMALKAVHDAKLAVRCMNLSKVILTDKNRIRLNGCSVLDVVQYDQQRPLLELQEDDLFLFGVLILSLAANNPGITPQTNPQIMQSAVDTVSRNYSLELVDTIKYLLQPAQSPPSKDLEVFIKGISTRMVSSFDSSLQANDELVSDLSRELENGRLVRLMVKLGNINERPDFNNEAGWAEHGEKYILKLFRDYVFHQVDADGRPVTDLSHTIRCLNKLDAGTDEKIHLTSRDGDNAFIVNYKELRKMVATAWNELQKPAAQAKRGF